jgi:predicted dehydrogenase
MNFLIVGAGSRGKRRARCLIACGISPENIRVVDRRPDRRDECRTKYNVEGFPTLDEGLRWNPSTVLVCLPGERATEVCSIVLQAAKHLFCEVPMGLNADETRRLGALAYRNGVLAAQGAQQPFHPLVIQCRDWVRDPSFGKPLLFHLEWGQYVPGWHPYENLNAFYSASQLLGVMNLEIVQFRFITGDRIRSLKCLRRQVSTLDTPGGDVCDMIGDTVGGLALNMHFDLLQRSLRNVARFSSEQAVVEIDFSTDSIRRYLAATKEWESIPLPKDYSYEQCYIDEIALLVRSVAGQAQWHNPITQGVEVASTLDAMRQSASHEPPEITA